VHGSKDRAKDASPGHVRRSLVPVMGACTLWRMPTAFPSSATFGHPLSSARAFAAEEPPHPNGPTEAFVPTTPREGSRLPENQDAFDRHDTRRNRSRRDRSLRPPRRLSRSRRPHFVLETRTVSFDWALRGHGAVTRAP
jgi:hypothetical protein